MSVYTDNLAQFVNDLLIEQQEKDTGKKLTKLSVAAAETAFKTCFDPRTLRSFRKGTAISAPLVVKFANFLQLNSVDRSELYIRWGESFLQRYSYRGVETSVPKGELDRSYQRSRLIDQSTRDYVTALRTLPRRAHCDPGIDPRDELREGIRKLTRSQSKEINSIYPGHRKTLKNFLEKGVMMRPSSFTKILASFTSPVPARGASKAEVANYWRRELTLEKLCAHYIESQFSDHDHFLNLSSNDWEKIFSPSFHGRLLAWFVASTSMYQVGRSGLTPYYWVANIPITLDGIGHGSRPLDL